MDEAWRAYSTHAVMFSSKHRLGLLAQRWAASIWTSRQGTSRFVMLRVAHRRRAFSSSARVDMVQTCGGGQEGNGTSLFRKVWQRVSSTTRGVSAR